MKLSAIQSAVNQYVSASKSAGTWTPSTDNIAGLLDKVAKTVQIDGNFSDKLKIFDGELLPLGKTIEEYFEDLATVADYDDAADPNAPTYPSYQSVSYNYTLGRKVIKTTLKYNEYQRACNTPEEYANLTNTVLKRLYDTYNIFRYDAKKAMLNNLITKAEAATNKSTLVGQITEITNAESGEAFLAQVKKDIETASFANEGHALNPTATIGATSDLVLVVKKGIKPQLDVSVMAGAFNPENLSLPVPIVVVDDFGGAADKYDAILVDKRGLRLHPTYMAVREQMNGAGDFCNYYLHTENTAFISKNVFVKIYKHAA